MGVWLRSSAWGHLTPEGGALAPFKLKKKAEINSWGVKKQLSFHLVSKEVEPVRHQAVEE